MSASIPLAVPVSVLRRRTLLSALAVGLPGFAAAADVAPLRVVASFSILADWARQVGGDAIELHALVGPDEDAHSFSPSPAAARQLARADVVLVNGLHFEGWIDRLVKSSGYQGPVVVVTQDVQVLKHDAALDPHAWQDIANARQAVARIAAAFAQARPAQAEVFRQRAAAYDELLQATDARIRERLATVARDQRRVITSHDAFGYFARAYGVQFLAIQGWNTEKEATAAQVARLIEQVKAKRVRAVFVENMSNPKLVQRLSAESGARLGGTLYADALSRPGGEADTYLKLMEHNVEALRQGMSAD